MAERPIVAELRAVDAALAPLAPSSELDHRIDALLAGRVRAAAPRRRLAFALSACAAAAALALIGSRAAPEPVAVAPVAPVLAPSPAPADAASGAVDGPAPVLSAAHSRTAEPAPSTLALARPRREAAPEAPALRARDDALSLPIQDEPRSNTLLSRDVKGAPAPRGALVARVADDVDVSADAKLERALLLLRADKARGDLRGAVTRIDALLQGAVGARAAAVLRLERARLQERLGDHTAACAGLLGLAGEDAQDARLRLACP